MQKQSKWLSNLDRRPTNCSFGRFHAEVQHAMSIAFIGSNKCVNLGSTAKKFQEKVSTKVTVK